MTEKTRAQELIESGEVIVIVTDTFVAASVWCYDNHVSITHRLIKVITNEDYTYRLQSLFRPYYVVVSKSGKIGYDLYKIEQFLKTRQARELK